MKIPIFQVDAFTDRKFCGNPAAVCPLEYWLDEEQLQAIAAENNLSETAFFVNRGDYFQLRWFTPQIEVDLCGHATLAAAHVIMTKMRKDISEITFGTHSGELTVRKENDLYFMDFPEHPPKKVDVPPQLAEALGENPTEILASNYYLAVFDSEKKVAALSPYMTLLKELDRMAVIATAPGDEVDFVSRFFAPAVGIPEDPVTGSAHCTLIPYWANKLGKNKLQARQISARGGDIFCERLDGRVIIAGKAVLFLEGSIWI